MLTIQTILNCVTHCDNLAIPMVSLVMPVTRIAKLSLWIGGNRLIEVVNWGLFTHWLRVKLIGIWVTDDMLLTFLSSHSTDIVEELALTQTLPACSSGISSIMMWGHFDMELRALTELYWLCICVRLSFKVACSGHGCGQQPSSLAGHRQSQ